MSGEDDHIDNHTGRFNRASWVGEGVSDLASDATQLASDARDWARDAAVSSPKAATIIAGILGVLFAFPAFYTLSKGTEIFGGGTGMQRIMGILGAFGAIGAALSIQGGWTNSPEAMAQRSGRREPSDEETAELREHNRRMMVRMNGRLNTEEGARTYMRSINLDEETLGNLGKTNPSFASLYIASRLGEEQFAEAYGDLDADQRGDASAELQRRLHVNGRAIMPVVGRQTSEFGEHRAGGKRHDGIDIAAPEGSTVAATLGGTVVEVGNDPGGYGRLVIVDHGNGVTSLYAHMHGIDVVEGQSIEAGQRIGGVGNTGRSSGPHVHYEVIVRRGENGYSVSPEDYNVQDLVDSEFLRNEAIDDAVLRNGEQQAQSTVFASRIRDNELVDVADTRRTTVVADGPTPI